MNTSEQRRKSIANIEAELWHPGPLIDFAYLFNSDTPLTRPIGHHHKVSRKLLDDFKERLDEARGRKLADLPLFLVLGELGELFAAIMFGIKLHAPQTQGSDGKLGNDFVEVKTITPGKKRDIVWFKRTGNFSKLVVVKITADFQFGARMVHRRILKKRPGLRVQLSWDEMIVGCGERALEVHKTFPMTRA